MYFFGLFVTFAGNVIAHQLLACPAQPKPPATMQKMRSTYMFPSPDHPVSFPRSPVSLPRSRPASYQIIHLLNGSVHLCSQFNGLLHRHVSSIYQFVHAHTLFTHLCHVGSSPGPGDILSSQRHSCTHIPFPHTCATRAPLQVLASMASVGRTPLHKATSICSNTSGDDFKHRSTSGGRRKFNRSSTLVKSGDKQPGGISAEDAALRNALSPEFQYVFNLTVFTLCVFFEGGHFHF